MKNNLKSMKRSCIISAVGVVIGIANIILSILDNQSMSTSIAIFCAMITIFIANISVYKREIKKERHSSDL